MERAWAAMLRDLQHVVQHFGGSGASGAIASLVYHSIPERAMGLAQQPPFPRATWKKLVTDLKVSMGCACTAA